MKITHLSGLTGAHGCLVVALMGLHGCASTTGIQQVEQAIERHAAAWNSGDMEGFLDYYDRSNVTFSSGGETQRGWDAIAERFRTRYGQPGKMGTLRFTNLAVTPLSSDAAMVLGDWHLTRSDGELRGNFTLVMRRIAGRWLIIHDHTSMRPQANSNAGGGPQTQASARSSNSSPRNVLPRYSVRTTGF